MKEMWFRHIERKDREAQYYKVLSLCTAGDVSNIKDGFAKLKESLDNYHFALFPWLPHPSALAKATQEGIIAQLNEELAYLEANPSFVMRGDGGTMSLTVPEYMRS